MNLEKKYRRANIPERFWDLTWDDFSTDFKGGEEILDAAWKWAENPNSHLPGAEDRTDLGRGLLFLGIPGTGKTVLASIVLQHILRQGLKGFFTTLPAYLSLITDQMKISKIFEYGEGTQDLYTEWMDKRQLVLDLRNKMPFLVLDDVGKEHLTASKFAQDEFDFLLRRRFDCALPTIITTNERVANWGPRYGEAMGSFINEAFEIIPFTGDDRRRA